MRLPGWCEGCRRVKQVRVTGAGMARVAAGHVAVGTCAQCEEREQDKRQRRAP